PQPFPMPPRPVAVRPETARSLELPGPDDARDLPDAIDPDGDGACPLTHPIKGKLSTGIYHRPGAFAYERTRADRCYRDESAAQSDGLRAAKRRARPIFPFVSAQPYSPASTTRGEIHEPPLERLQEVPDAGRPRRDRGRVHPRG